jgi:hypothetical protein
MKKEQLYKDYPIKISGEDKVLNIINYFIGIVAIVGFSSIIICLIIKIL